jgi:predicted kinase
MMLIVMAGLPSSGKSSLAAALQPLLGAVVLNKDAVRAVLFPPPVLDYSTAQDDVCMAAIYQAAAVIQRSSPRQAVIIDGRTFLRSYQIHDVVALAASLNTTPRIIECVCDDDVAKARLESDLAQGEHPAGNRTYALYLALKAAAEPITVPRLLLDTGKTPLEECVKRSITYLSEQS